MTSARQALIKLRQEAMQALPSGADTRSFESCFKPYIQKLAQKRSNKDDLFTPLYFTIEADRRNLRFEKQILADELVFAFGPTSIDEDGELQSFCYAVAETKATLVRNLLENVDVQYSAGWILVYMMSDEVAHNYNNNDKVASEAQLPVVTVPGDNNHNVIQSAR